MSFEDYRRRAHLACQTLSGLHLRLLRETKSQAQELLPEANAAQVKAEDLLARLEGLCRDARLTQSWEQCE